MREEKTFRVVVFRFETDASTNYTRYMITKNYIPFFPGNQYRAASNVNDARKALKTQACPGIGHVRVAPPLL